jgi:hypothetical protein
VKPTTRFLVPLAIGAGLVFSGTPWAQQPSAPAPAAVDPDARAILMKMAEHLSGLQKFGVRIRSGYDVVQDSGQKIEFNEVRTVIVKRPDRFRADIIRSDGDKGIVIFDGKDIAVYNDSEHVYATTNRPGTLDGAITYFVQDLKMRLPLAAMFLTGLPAELERRVTEIVVVEESTIDREVFDHIAARTETVDFQVWVPKTKNPLPRRIVLTYKQADGQPQYWAEFSEWNMAPDVADKQFTFTPPTGAERITFAAQTVGPGKQTERSEVAQ